MNVTLQVVVALHRFRNIDILSQGLFRIVVSVTSTDNSDEGEHFRLMTLGHTRRPASDGRHTVESDYCKEFIPDPDNEMIGNGAWGSSRTFFVRYEGQVEPLTEMMTFELDVPICDAFSATRDFLVVHYDLYHLQKERMVNPDANNAHADLAKFAFVQRRSAPIPNPSLCVNTYLPLVFQKWYFATITSTVHITMVGFVVSNEGDMRDVEYRARTAILL